MGGLDECWHGRRREDKRFTMFSRSASVAERQPESCTASSAAAMAYCVNCAMRR